MNRHNCHSMVLGILLLSTLAAQAQDGQWREINENKCGRCHRVYDPTEFSRNEWNQALHSMRARAGLSKEEHEGLASLAENGANAELGERDAPQLGGYLYTEYFQSPDKIRNYDIHYLAIHLSGWVGDQVEYLGEFEFEHGGKGDNTFVEQAWMDYWFTHNMALRIGAILTPFNRFDEIHDPLSNPLVTRPQMAREIGVSAWKDVGVDLHGHFRLSKQLFFDFDIYSINGLGAGSNLRGSRQYRDNNEDKAFGVRSSFVLSDSYELGMSAYRGAWDDNGDLMLGMIGAHARLRTPLVNIHAEYADALSENTGSVADGEMTGYFIQAVRELNSKLKFVARWGELDYLDIGSDQGRDPERGDKDISELALGLTFSPDPRVIFKLEYSINGEGARAEAIDNDQLGLQAAVSF